MYVNYQQRVRLFITTIAILIVGGGMPRGKRNVDYIFIHHSATPRDTTEHDAVKRYHIEERGWSDIGYHYTIDYAGVVRKGRKDNTVGAHVKNHNKKSLGICLFGNFENENPSKQQIDALIPLLQELQKKYKVPAGHILAHKDKGNTDCCGKNLYGLLPWVRTQLQQNPQ